MNIALVVHDLHEYGGHSRYTRILADELSRRHQVTVFANRCERPDDARWRSCSVRAWRTNALATVRTFPLGLRSLKAQLADFDIRHMQGYCGGLPNVVTAHICMAAYLNSLQGTSKQSRVSLSLMAAAEARFYRRYDGHIIAISQKIAAELQNFYQVRGPITVIPHGVDASRFGNEDRERKRVLMRNEARIDAHKIVALYVGDLTKSHSHLKTIAAAVPEVEFIIVTSSTRYHWTSSNVHILPSTSDLSRYYAGADVFLFPTTYDAFGMVVLEAMAAGLPVFSSDRAGAAEHITSGKDGFVIPFDHWVEATASGLSSLDSLGTIGREAAKTARRHDWPTVVRRVDQVYSQVAGAIEAAPAGSAISRNEYRYQQ